VRSGHITGSKNLPFTELLNENGTLKSDKELANIFLAKGIDTTLPIINTCGSGVTACIVDLGLKVLGAEKSKVYDGSWTEYVRSCYSFFRGQFQNLISRLINGTSQVRSELSLF